jgi:hypothetical protein
MVEYLRSFIQAGPLAPYVRGHERDPSPRTSRQKSVTCTWLIPSLLHFEMLSLWRGDVTHICQQHARYICRS